MSIIGLYDYDMSTYTHVPFNLDLMKIATYYKNKKDVVVLNPILDLDKYTKTIYRKDYYDGQFSSSILLDNRVEYGGRAFNKGAYTSLPIEIEQCKPDRYIYNIMKNRFCTNKTNTILFNQMLRAQHVRLSLDGKTVWKDWKNQIDPTIQTRTFIFHDYDLAAINGSVEVIKDIYKNMPGNQTKYMGMKFPVQIYDKKTLLEWSQFYPMSSFYSLQYNGLMSDDCLIDFYEKQKGTSICKQTVYNVTANCTEEQFIKERILPLYLQIVFLRMNRQSILLKYDNTIFSDKRWVRILDLFKHYLTQGIEMPLKEFNRIVPFDSLYSFVSSFEDAETYKFHFTTTQNKLMLIDEARELFRMVYNDHYELFKAFYECHTVKHQGGKLYYD